MTYHWSYMVSSILVSVLFMAVFICSFFFLYGSLVEKSIVVNEISDIVDRFTTDLQLVLPDQSVSDLLKYVEDTKLPDFTEEDKEVQVSNKKLQMTALLFGGLFVLVVLIVVVALWVKFRYNMGQMLGYNLLTLVFVGLVYGLFVTFFMGRYQLLDYNFVKSVVLQQLKTF